MSHPKQTPSSIRKIRARLRNYTRPFVWGSVLVLGLLTVLIWEFSQDPERFYLFTLENDEEVDIEDEPEGWTGISMEDSGIAADIDSSSVLLNDLNQMQPPPEMQIPTRGTNTNRRSSGARSQPNPTQPSPNTDVGTVEDLNQNGENPYNLPELSILPPPAPSSQELPEVSVPGIPTDSGNGIGTPSLPGSRLGIYSGSVNNFETPNLTQLPVSPLQAAMDRLYSPNNSTRGDRNSEETPESQASESNPQGESNPGSSPENRPNSPQNRANSGSPTSPSPSGNTAQPPQTPNGTPQNASSPSGNTAQSAQSPYGTPLTSPSPYGNTPQPLQTPNGTPQNIQNPYLVEEFSPNRGSIDPNVPLTPRLPGEISPSYGVDYTGNNYQPLPSIPPVPNSNPTNAYDYLLRSGGEQVPLAPAAPTAAPVPPSNLGVPSYQPPNSSVYQAPNMAPPGNPSSISPGVQPLNQPSDRPSPSSVNPPNNVPTYQPLNPPSVQSPPVDSSGLNLNPGTPGVQPIQPIQPFSVPTSVPGRHIGGGNINTFSNP